MDAPPPPKSSKALAQHQALLQTLSQKVEVLWIGVLRPYRRRGLGALQPRVSRLMKGWLTCQGKLLKGHIDALVSNDKKIVQVTCQAQSGGVKALLSDWIVENDVMTFKIPPSE